MAVSSLSPQSTYTSWLRIESYPSGSQDTSVWELPYKRPRLTK
ncbi:MAG TPA: hypothetical protein VGE04_19335 [Chloroflexia bacterium]